MAVGEKENREKKTKYQTDGIDGKKVWKRRRRDKEQAKEEAKRRTGDLREKQTLGRQQWGRKQGASMDVPCLVQV